MFANLNAGDPTKWTYVADPTRPAAAAQSFRPISLRLTVQANARNKFGLFWDEQLPCEGAAFQGAPDSVQACRRSEAGEIIAGGASPTPSVERDRRAGNRRVSRRRQQGAAGDVAVAGHQPPAARSRAGHLRQQVGRRPDAGQSGRRSDPHHRTVRERLREQRQHREPDLPLAQLRRQLAGLVQLARVGVVCARRAEHEVRLPGRLPGRQPQAVFQQPGADLPDQQRRAGPDHRDHRSLLAVCSACATTRSTRRKRGRSAG